MSNLVSANWNLTYGMDNPKNVLNKTSHFGVMPINQHYLFFKNGATSVMQNDTNISPELKQALERENIARAKRYYGNGTERPAGFTEQAMADLYYNSYGLNFRVGSQGMPIDPLTVSLLTGGQTSLLGLLASQTIAAQLQIAAIELFYSSTIFQMPKIGYTDYYTYKSSANQKNVILSSIVNRKYPNFNKNINKLEKDQLVNLSSQEGFKKITGGSSYDTILSKYQFNGGCGFLTSIFRDINSTNLQKFIENIKSNSEIKYSQLNKLKSKFQGNSIALSQATENSILNEMKGKINGMRNISIYIDFSDYTTVKISSSAKSYANSQKEKSIFGPYICRSKKAFLYYPKIIIIHPKYSTLARYSNNIEWSGGINIFGSYPTIYPTGSLSDLGSFELLARIASFGIPPTIDGVCTYITKDEAFSLGAAYSENIQSYNSKPIC